MAPCAHLDFRGHWNNCGHKNVTQTENKDALTVLNLSKKKDSYYSYKRVLPSTQTLPTHHITTAKANQGIISPSRWMLHKIWYIFLSYIYSKILLPIGNGIILKNHVSCHFILKYYMTILLQQFTKTLDRFLNLSTANENLEICIPVLLE